MMEPRTVYVVAEEWNKMWTAVRLCKTEITFYFEGEEKDKELYLTKLVIPKQTCSSATTDVSAEQLAELCISEELKPSRFRAWFHSHVNMGVFESGVDERQREEFIKDCSSWFITGIVNKKYEMLANIWWLGYKVPCDICPIYDDTTMDEEIQQIIDERVSESAATTYYGNSKRKYQYYDDYDFSDYEYVRTLSKNEFAARFPNAPMSDLSNYGNLTIWWYKTNHYHHYSSVSNQQINLVNIKDLSKTVNTLSKKTFVETFPKCFIDDYNVFGPRTIQDYCKTYLQYRANTSGWKTHSSFMKVGSIKDFADFFDTKTDAEKKELKKLIKENASMTLNTFVSRFNKFNFILSNESSVNKTSTQKLSVHSKVSEFPLSKLKEAYPWIKDESIFNVYANSSISQFNALMSILEDEENLIWKALFGKDEDGKQQLQVEFLED
jgi:hypothetical protein